jgi:hypothetical protein
MGWHPVDYAYQANHAHDYDVDWSDAFRYVLLPILILLVWFIVLKMCWDLSHRNLPQPQPRYEPIPEAGSRSRAPVSKLV